MTYKKSRKTGVVINTDDFSEYLQRRESVKETMRAKQDLRKTKSDLASMHQELAEVKDLLKQILEKK